jgi:hypothetical protein
MKKKITLTVLTFLMFTVPMYAQSVSKLKVAVANLNQVYLIPIFVIIFSMWVIVTGLMNLGEMRKGGEAAKTAAISWLVSCLWPFGVMAVAEGIILLLQVFSA